MALSHLKNVSSGLVTEEIDTETTAYRKLIQQKTGNKPLWEDISVTDIPATNLERALVTVIPPLTLLQDESERLSVGVTKGGTLTAAEYFADEAITGVTTNGRTLTVINLDTAVTMATLEFKTGTNAVVGTGAAFVINSAAVTGGNELEVLSAHTGTGIADPGGIVIVTVKFTA